MNVTGLRERISAWEDLHTDFKEQIDSADELAKDLVCFANTDGGQLILGVADDRSISGIDDVDATNRSVDNVAFDNCNPPVTVVQEVLEVDGSRVVVVNVPKGDQRPYSTIRGRYYVRTTSGCRPASRQELLRLFQATESLYYDETTLPRLSRGLNCRWRHCERPSSTPWPIGTTRFTARCASSSSMTGSRSTHLAYHRTRWTSAPCVLAFTSSATHESTRGFRTQASSHELVPAFAG